MQIKRPLGWGFSIIIALLCVVTSSGSHHRAQSSRNDLKLKLARRTVVLPVIVDQSNSPISFQDVSYAVPEVGTGSALFRIKNRSNVPITHYEVWAIGPGIGTGVREGLAGPLLPGEIRPDMTHTWQPPPETWPSGGDDEMEAVVFMMVVRAEMADGAVFDDSKVFESLKVYCIKLFEEFYKRKTGHTIRIDPSLYWGHDPAQSSQSDLKYKLVRRTVILPVIVDQPSAPISFEDVAYGVPEAGTGWTFFRIRNRSTIPITSFEVRALLPGTGSGWSLREGVNSPLLPGQVKPDEAREWDNSSQTWPASGDDEMKAVVFLMVVRAKMADGSVFDDSKVFEALNGYCSKLSVDDYKRQNGSK
jgi:hypothetical protein